MTAKEKKRVYDEQYRRENSALLRAKHAAYVRKWRHRIRLTQAARYQQIKEVKKLEARERYARNPQKYIDAVRAYERANKPKVRDWKAKRRRRRKLDVLNKYGGVCACCGESEPVFLTIDHVKNDGKEHRKTINGDKFYRWLLENPASPDYQVLCMNCNWGKSQNKGICPHQQKKGSECVSLSL